MTTMPLPSSGTGSCKLTANNSLRRNINDIIPGKEFSVTQDEFSIRQEEFRKSQEEIRVTQVLFTLKWRLMTQILLALPVIGLFLCLITSLIFHADHINNTICEVYNFLPSISAVTGVSPQRYLWRVCVALHISPRLLVAWVAREFYTSLATKVKPVHRPAFQGMVTFAFCLNLTELATLCGVTYISNKENYPVHEKLFMLFMMASLIYMVCIVRLLQTIENTLSPHLLRSLSHKKWLLGTKISATIGLLFFFWRHRVHCQPKAFSWFSLCEYIIATCNMLYHVSVALDFADEHLIVGHIVLPSAPSSASLTTPDTAVTHNSWKECCNTFRATPEQAMEQMNTISEEVNRKLEEATHRELDTNEERNVAIKTKPPECLDLVSSSSSYSRFSGSSNSSSASAESPCTTDSSCDNNSSPSGSSTYSGSSVQSSVSSPDVGSAPGLRDSNSSESPKHCLSTIHENQESGVVNHPTFPSSEQDGKGDQQFIVKERLTKAVRDDSDIYIDPLTRNLISENHHSKDLSSDTSSKYLTYEDHNTKSKVFPSPETLPFQPSSNQKFSCLEKTHLE